MRKKKKRLRREIKTFFSSIVCVCVITAVLFSVSKTWLNIHKKQKEKEELSEKLIILQKEELGLATDVAKLKDPEYIARFLREKYFYSTSGEYIIRLPQ